MNMRRAIRWMSLAAVLVVILSLLWLASTQRALSDVSFQTQPASDRRRASDRFLARSVQQTPAALSIVREIALPPEIGRIRHFVVANRRLIAIEGPPGRRLITAQLGKSARLPADAGTSRLALADPLSIDYDPHDPDTIWVYDFRAGDLASFALSPSAREVRRVKLPPGLFQPVWVGERVIANGLFAGELVRAFKRSGDSMDPDGAWGRSPFPDVLPEIAIHLNRSAIAIDPARRRAVLAFLYASRLEVMGTDGTSQRGISGPAEIRLDYRTVNDPVEGIERFIRTPATRYGYVSVIADDARIYALFSGRSKGEWNKNAILADTLHVFAWSGELLGEWRLPKAVYSIALDAKAHELYAVGPAPSPAIIELDGALVLGRATIR